jgi:hypothetical protein
MLSQRIAHSKLCAIAENRPGRPDVGVVVPVVPEEQAVNNPVRVGVVFAGRIGRWEARRIRTCALWFE